MFIFDDIQIALRSMRYNLRFALLAILVVTSGMTMSLFLHSIVSNTIDAPMPFADGERLRRIDLVENGRSFHGENLSFYEYSQIEQNTRDLWQAFSLYTRLTANVSDGGRAIRYEAVNVTEQMFSITGAEPLLGRNLSAADMLPSTPNVVVIKESVWRDMFARDASVVGKSLRINGLDYEVVGVLGDDFGFPHKAKIWLPLREQLTLSEPNQGPGAALYGVLKAGVSDEQINREVGLVMAQLANAHQSLQGRSTLVRTFQQGVIGGAVQIMVAMQVAVIFVLLLACTNISNMLFTRAIERSKETAIRQAIGAPLIRLLTQMLIESFIICLFSGLLSLGLVALWLHMVGLKLPSIIPFEIPMWWVLGVNSSVVINTAILVLVTTILTSVMPIFQALRNDIRAVLQDSDGGKGRSSGWMTRLVVVLEISLCAALLVTAANLVNHINSNNGIDVGIETNGFLTAKVALPEQTYTTPESVNSYYDDLIHQLDQDGRVQGAALVSTMPLEWAWRRDIKIEGNSYAPDARLPQTNYIVNSANYAQVVNLTLFEGRHLNEFDKADSPMVAVISKSFADTHWPQGSPLNKRFKFADSEQWVSVVGVVDNITYGTASVANQNHPSVYISNKQHAFHSLVAVMKASGDPYALQGLLGEVMIKINVDIAPFSIISLQGYIELEGAGFAFLSELFVVFSVVALVLAFSGVYSVMSNTIINRSKEICIRRAIGAPDSNIYQLFILQSSKLLLIGISIGSVIGWLIMSKMASSGQLQISYLIFAVVTVLLIGVIIAAVVFPVRKVLQIEPQEALKTN